MALKPFCQQLWAAIILLGIWTSQALDDDDDDALMADKHDQWAAEFGRVYKSNEEKMARFKIFKKNVEYITAFNKAGARPYKLGLNQFTDLTNDEFKAFGNGYKKTFHRNSSKVPTSFKHAALSENVPRSKNWIDYGAVSGTPNQGSCGSCWAFSAVAAIEGIHKIKTEFSIVLSAQELIDCNRGPLENHGCKGGNVATAFDFVKKHGLATDDIYPYTGVDGTCDLARVTWNATIKGYDFVEQDNEAALLIAVARQPISVTIDSNGFNFQHYSGGVFDGPCGTDQNHQMTIIGYGEDTNGMKYWLVKNSYGWRWGVGGYIKMKKDTGGHGLCGLAIKPIYPTM